MPLKVSEAHKNGLTFELLDYEGKGGRRLLMIYV